MILFFAGNSGHGNSGRIREEMIRNLSDGRILSYFWYGEKGDFFERFIEWVEFKQNVRSNLWTSR